MNDQNFLTSHNSQPIPNKIPNKLCRSPSENSERRNLPQGHKEKMNLGPLKSMKDYNCLGIIYSNMIFSYFAPCLICGPNQHPENVGGLLYFYSCSYRQSARPKMRRRHFGSSQSYSQPPEIRIEKIKTSFITAT